MINKELEEILDEEFSKEIRINYINFNIYLNKVKNEQTKKILEILNKIFIFNENSEKDTLAITVFNDEEYNIMEKLVEETKYDMLKAKIYYILFINNKKQKYIEKFIQAYFETVKQTYDVEHWVVCNDYLTFLIELIIKFNKDTQLIIDFIDEKIIDSINNKGYAMCSSLVENIIRIKNDNEKYIIYLDEIIKQTSRSDFYITDSAFKLKLNIYRKKQQKRDETIKELAELYEQLGDECGFEKFYNAIDNYEKAILQYKKIKRQDDKVEKILRKLEPLKKEITKNLSTFKQKIDTTKIKQISKTMLEDVNTMEEKIILFGLNSEFIKKSKLKDTTIKRSKASITSMLFGETHIDKEGKTIIKIPPLDINNIDENVLKLHMNRTLITDIEFMANSYLIDFMRSIKQDEKFCLDNVKFLVNDNFMIPEDRKEIIALGIFLMLNEDYYAGLHILVPQIENLFRVIAKGCGAIVTTFEDDLTEKAKTLTSIFDVKELVECYDEDILFTFKAILNERSGANLRNLIAHGIYDRNQSYSGIVKYFLGIVIRMCYMYSKYCLDIGEQIVKKDILKHK